MTDPRGQTVRSIRREWHEWEQQFLPVRLPAGIPNREALRRAAAAEAEARAKRPENEAIRSEFRRRLEEAQRVASGQSDVIESPADVVAAKRQVVRRLFAWGFVADRNTGSSIYLSRDGFRVRVSDHAIPETEERRNRKSWCRSTWQLVIRVGMQRAVIEKWLCRVSLEVAKPKRKASE